MDWIQNLKPKDLEPICIVKIHFVGAKRKETLELKRDVQVEDNVFIGYFEPDAEYLVDVPNVFTVYYDVSNPKPKKINALGKIIKITSRTVWVRVGSVHNNNYQRGDILKLSFDKVGRSIDKKFQYNN